MRNFAAVICLILIIPFSVQAGVDQRIQPYQTPSKPRHAPTNTRNYDPKIGSNLGGLTDADSEAQAKVVNLL